MVLYFTTYRGSNSVHRGLKLYSMNKVSNSLFRELNDIVSDGYEFNSEEIRRLTQPCIYLYLRNNVIIYVGISKHGISRGLEPHQNGFCEKGLIPLVLEADQFIIYPVINYRHQKDLMIIENLIIDYYKPKYNKRVKKRSKNRQS